MQAIDSVETAARAFVARTLTTSGLYDWLCSRADAIQDELEAELWLVIDDVQENAVSEAQARHQVAKTLSQHMHRTRGHVTAD